MRRNLIATMLVSQGTPMILMGDEVGRSQGGNNNAYCQDDADQLAAPGTISTERDAAFRDFVRGVVGAPQQPADAQAAALPARRRGRARADRWTSNGCGRTARAMESHDWEQPETRALAMLLGATEDHLLLLLFNADAGDVRFHLPEQMGRAWRLVLDTASGAVYPGHAGPTRWVEQSSCRPVRCSCSRAVHERTCRGPRNTATFPRSWGAEFLREGEVRFRIWAPPGRSGWC